MKRVLIAMSCAILLSGCGADDVVTTTVGIDSIQFEIPSSYEKQPSGQEYNTKLGSRPVLVFSQKSETVQDFDNNVLVTKTPFNAKTSSLEATTAIMVDSIQSTFGSYAQESLKTQTYVCGADKKKAYKHRFSLVQGDLEITKNLYFVQYYFVESNRLYVLSGIGDDSADADNHESYFKSLKCKPQDAV